jgi:Protein of unknown function (DUF2637)
MTKTGIWERLGKFATNPVVIGWLCVLTAALAMSDYSLFIVARHFDTPPVFAVLLGVIFDGAAVVLATIAFNSVKSGYPGSGAKLGTLLCVALSSYINSYHQTLLNQPLIAKLVWASPPVIAFIVLEAHMRFVKRRTLANQGRIAPDLPTFGKWAWLLFPVKTLRIARTIVRYRLGYILARQTPGMVHASPPVPIPGSGELLPGSGVSGGSFPELPASFSELAQTTGYLGEVPTGSLAHVREWARASGLFVNRRGPIPADVVQKYILAHTPRQIAPAESPNAETGEIDGEEFSVEVARKPGHLTPVPPETQEPPAPNRILIPLDSIRVRESDDTDDTVNEVNGS